MEDTGQAIGRAGDAVDGLSDVPLVGEGFTTVADEIRGIGRETVQNGRSVEDDVDSLAVLVGAGLALGPTLPILALWVPARVSRERERHALRRSLKSDDRIALAYLANRAVATRDFRELLSASDDPVADLAAGRYEALAALELDHLSLGSLRRRPGGASACAGAGFSRSLRSDPRSPTRGRGRATPPCERSREPTIASRRADPPGCRR